MTDTSEAPGVRETSGNRSRTSCGRISYFPGPRSFLAHVKFVHRSFNIVGLIPCVPLFLAVVIANVSLIQGITLLGPLPAGIPAPLPFLLFFVFAAPFVEESAKRWANRRGYGSTYVVTSSWTEFLLYVGGMASPAVVQNGPAVFALVTVSRLGSVLLHIYTQQIQLADVSPSRPTERHRGGFYRAWAVHGTCNALLLCAGALLSVVATGGL